jgi:uncharacterized membrane protein YgcG
VGKIGDLFTDPQKDLDGVEFPYDHGVVWIVARFGNEKFQEEINKRLFRMPEWERRKVLRGESDEHADAVKIAFGKFCLVGWRDLENAEGQTILYSQEYSVKLCRDPAFDAVYKEILAFSQNPENYRQEVIEDISGNSPGSSAGGSSGGGGKRGSKSGREKESTSPP